MKLPKSVQIKETSTLFANKYNYKIVLVCSVASWFRSKNYVYTRSRLDEVTPAQFSSKFFKIKSDKELDNFYKILNLLESFNDKEYSTRVESPLISIYTSNTGYIEKLAAIDESIIKFVCLPSKNIQRLDPDKVVVKTLDYDYKIYLNTIKNKDHRSFLNWAQDNNKVRMTKKCIKDLKQNYSLGGSYLYVKGNKTLTMVKMFLEADIRKIKQVIKL